MADIKVIATPVVYTNNNGGGPDELEAPTNAEASKDFNAGGPVSAAWWRITAAWLRSVPAILLEPSVVRRLAIGTRCDLSPLRPTSFAIACYGRCLGHLYTAAR